ncbi:MAG: hypothetical protein WAV93_09015 [Bacteroidales bacterium]
MKTIASVFLIMMLVVSSCSGPRLNFDKGIIPPHPVSFPAVNSIFDDYNSDLKITWSEKNFTLIFSTNRNSFGNDFDLISYQGRIEFDLIDGDFKMAVSHSVNALLTALNSGNNELGPAFTHDYPHFNPYYIKEEDVKRFFYTSDPEGDLDIFCSGYQFGDGVFIPEGEPFPLTPLNTVDNEGYLSIHSGASANRETVYFMSDRAGSYDIYLAVSEEGKLISESASASVIRSSVLSSIADDKCPYINGNIMVFTSDRAGGFGGFDLWYSVFNGQVWSAPVNMGADINTEYDEYRPVFVSTREEGFLNDLMVFSSNRPGGYGGFDLYYVGIPRRE